MLRLNFGSCGRHLESGLIWRERQCLLHFRGCGHSVSQTGGNGCLEAIEREALFGRARQWNAEESTRRVAVTMQPGEDGCPCSLYLRRTATRRGRMSQNRFCSLRTAGAVIYLAQTSKRQVVIGSEFQDGLVLLFSLIRLSRNDISVRQQQASRSVLWMCLKMIREDSY